MQTSKANPFSRKRLVISVAVGLLLFLLQKRFVPQSSQSDFSRASAQWAIVLLSFSGGYVLLKERNRDVEYYRSKMPRTEETERALQQRRRKFGYVGVALIVLGSIYLVALLMRLT